MYSERVANLVRLENKLNSDVLLLCNNLKESTMLDYEMVDVIRRIMRVPTRHKNLAIILQTFGGDGFMTYLIIGLLREYYNKISIYVVGDCYSAGTCMAFQADKIFMGRNACLGPIDGQFNGNFDKGCQNWFPSLQSNINTLVKAEQEGKITPFLKETFKKRPDILAVYFRTQNSDDDLFKSALKRHTTPEKFEEAWQYMTGEIGWHGVPITYKKAREKGFDVKRMTGEVENLITLIIRNAEGEFGDLVRETPMRDWLDANIERNEEKIKQLQKLIAAKKAELAAKKEDDGSKPKKLKKTKKIKIDDETEFADRLIIDYEVILSVIETCRMGYSNYELYGLEELVTKKGSSPFPLIYLLEEGWHEEEGAISLKKEEYEKFVSIYNALIKQAAENAGIDFEHISPDQISKIQEVIQSKLADATAEAYDSPNNPIEYMSYAERQELVVRYVLESYFGSEEDNARDEIILEAAYRLAEKKGLDISKLNGTDVSILVDEVTNEFMNEAIKYANLSEEECNELTPERLEELLNKYLDSLLAKENK